MNTPKYIMGGFVLPLKRECDTPGASGKVRVKDTRGRLVKTFNSVQMADQFVNQYNAPTKTLQDEVEERHEEFQGYLSDDGSADYSLRNEGRNPDGSGMSYAERQ